MPAPTTPILPRGSLAWDRTHRSRRRFRYPLPTLLFDVAFVGFLTWAVWWSLDALAPWWVDAFNFWSERTGLDARMRIGAGDRAWGLVPAVTVDAGTVMPTGTVWWVTAAVTVLAWFASGRMHPERMPFKYLLRLFLIIEFSALAYFYVWPAALPTPVDGFLADLTRQSAAFMLLLPVLFGLTLFPFALPWPVKYGAVLAGLVFLVMAVPLQVVSNAWVLQHASLMAMPVLYLFLGLLPQVMALMGLYGFALSLLPPDDELIARGVLRA